MSLEQILAPAVPDGLFQVRSHEEISLGPVLIEIRSNEPDFKGFRFFSERSRPRGKPHFTLSLCNLLIDGPWSVQSLAAMHDKSYRGKKMSAGYYLTDHFGAPAYLVTRGTHHWIFAEDFEPILWPYVIKHLLTVFAMEHKMLHLKAAGVAVDGRGALLVGRGGGGKTVLLSHLCRSGAQFLSNTHALVDGTTLIGIPTAMRVRKDAFFGPVIAARGLSPSVKAGEYVADPRGDLRWSHLASSPVRSVYLLDYKGPGSSTIREIERETLFDYMEQFALAINVYGLKEDILDFLGGEVPLFSAEVSQMKARLSALLETTRCYYLSCDAAEPRNLQIIWDLLREAHTVP